MHKPIFCGYVLTSRQKKTRRPRRTPDTLKHGNYAARGNSDTDENSLAEPDRKCNRFPQKCSRFLWNTRRERLFLCPSWTHLFFPVKRTQLLLGVVAPQHPVYHLNGERPGIAAVVNVAVQQLGQIQRHALLIFFLCLLFLQGGELHEGHHLFLPLLGELVIAHDQVRLIWYC